MSTAIIHLTTNAAPTGCGVLAPMLGLIRGVQDATFDPAVGMMTIRFDQHRTSLADLVRAIEDTGSRVTGVAQR